MANMIDHYLKAPNLKKILIDAGVIESKTLHGINNREVHHEHVLNMKKCCEEYWKELELAAKEDGAELTYQEIEELHYWPICFESDDEISWICKWRSNDDIAHSISKLFPEITFEYEMFYEGEWDGAFTVKDDEFDATEGWAEALRGVCKQSNADCDHDDVLQF